MVGRRDGWQSITDQDIPATFQPQREVARPGTL